MFFRQSPLGVDEPPFARSMPGPHIHPLADFAVFEIGTIKEEDIFYEATSDVREKAKNWHAPRSDRKFNNFNGAQQVFLAPTGPSAISADFRSSWRFNKREPLASGGSNDYEEGVWRPALSERIKPITDPRSYGAKSNRSYTPPFFAIFEPQALWSAPSADGPAPAALDEFGAYDEQRTSKHLQRRTKRLGGDIPTVDANQDDTPFSAVLAVPHTWNAGFQTIKEALAAIHKWAPSITEPEPSYPELGILNWNQKWLEGAMLVCEDPRSFWRLKMYTAVRQDISKMEDLLEIGIRFGIPFALYIKRKDVQSFSDPNISAHTLNTLAAIYEPGFTDLQLSWGSGGPVACYVQYEANLHVLLARLEAVAFVCMGSVMRYVANLYNPDIVYRFAHGLSLQVSQFDKGVAHLYNRNGEEEFYTTDRVSPDEIGILLGIMPGNNPGAMRTLWPPPEVFESESLHMCGYLSEGAFAILENLRCNIFEKKKYKWRTKAHWHKYFRVGNRNEHTPAVVPKKKDFEAGEALFAASFPVQWLNMEIVDITLLEEFSPHSP
ncbi:hypothetical protein B0H19DRAFT_1255836 [Mycena capillaripes]|nr:hypothetical protein B0H19DRAFT_1255836 [Mycena capillaripes]